MISNEADCLFELGRFGFVLAGYEAQTVLDLLKSVLEGFGRDEIRYRLRLEILKLGLPGQVALPQLLRQAIDRGHQSTGSLEVPVESAILLDQVEDHGFVKHLGLLRFSRKFRDFQANQMKITMAGLNPAVVSA